MRQTVLLFRHCCFGKHGLINIDDPVAILLGFLQLTNHLGLVPIEVAVVLLLRPLLPLNSSSFDVMELVHFAQQCIVHPARRELLNEMFGAVLQQQTRLSPQCLLIYKPIYLMRL